MSSAAVRVGLKVPVDCGSLGYIPPTRNCRCSEVHSEALLEYDLHVAIALETVKSD